MHASEFRKFSHFHILKLLFLSIFCWYFRYLVGTDDMLVGLHIPTNFQMYLQNSQQALELVQLSVVKRLDLNVGLGK